MINLFAAPDSCLQYYTGVTGTLLTFNYMDAAGLQLSNTDYTMCIRLDPDKTADLRNYKINLVLFRSERNFCGIQYTACPDTSKF